MRILLRNKWNISHVEFTKKRRTSVKPHFSQEFHLSFGSCVWKSHSIGCPIFLRSPLCSYQWLYIGCHPCWIYVCWCFCYGCVTASHDWPPAGHSIRAVSQSCGRLHRNLPPLTPLLPWIRNRFYQPILQPSGTRC